MTKLGSAGWNRHFDRVLDRAEEKILAAINQMFDRLPHGVAHSSALGIALRGVLMRDRDIADLLRMDMEMCWDSMWEKALASKPKPPSVVVTCDGPETVY